MRYVLVSIKDRAIDAFLPVNNVRAEGEALRNFNDLLSNPQASQYHEHPEDFDLYVVGYFDDHSGLIERLDTPKKIADGKALSNVKLQG